MLKQLRQKKAMKKILWALAIIIIPVFVLWGSAGLRESSEYAGMIFGKKVTFAEYRAAYNAVKNDALLKYGSKFQDVQDKLGLEGAAWDHLIMLEEAKRHKIKVSDEEVIQYIASFPFFWDKDGGFNPNTYAMILTNAFRTDPRQFEEEIRRILMIQKLIQRETAFEMGSIGVSDEEIEEALQEVLEKEAREEAAEAKEAGPEEEAEAAAKPQPESKPEEAEVPEETLDEKRDRIRSVLFLKKRLAAYQAWRDTLYDRADFISNFKKPKPE